MLQQICVEEQQEWFGNSISCIKQIFFGYSSACYAVIQAFAWNGDGRQYQERPAVTWYAEPASSTADWQTTGGCHAAYDTNVLHDIQLNDLIILDGRLE